MLQYNFFVILKHTQHSTLDSLLLLGACFNELQYNFFVILKHTNDMGNWISLSNRTNFGNELQYNFFVILKHTKNPNLTNLAQDMFQYNFSLRFLSQDCGLLSPCNMIVLGVVLARNYIIKFLMNLLQLTLSFVAMCLL